MSSSTRETELKILEIDPSSVRKTLKKSRAKFVKRVFQRNIFFKNLLTFKKHITVRIRIEGRNSWLAVKSPKKIVNNHKIKDEYELKIPSYDWGFKMLSHIGLKLWGESQAKREYYNLHSCSVEIIVMPTIPPFLEIEGSQKNILKVAKLLGYSQSNYCAKNVIQIYGKGTRFLKF